jgi:site-specific DNA recombinase
MKAVLFCRVSSREQEETGYSLPAQEKLLKTYSEKQGFSIYKVFSISESASGKKQRDIFERMMSYLLNLDIKVIVCEKVDRLTRNFKDAVNIDEWLDADESRQVHLVKDSLVLHKNSRSQEKLNWGIRIIFAKNYIDNLSEEVKKGQKEKISQGWLPTKPPLGYKTVGERGHKIHVIDDTKGHLIRKLFELYGSGNYSLRTVTEEICNLGLRNFSGNKVVKSRIHLILTNPFYIGKIQWNGNIYDGLQEPLIDINLFEEVQKLIKRKNPPKYNKHLFLFKGVIRCDECKGTITWERQKSHNYGHCNHYRECSQRIWVREEELIKQLLPEFEKLQLKNRQLVEWVRIALKESHQNESQFHEASRQELNRRYVQIQQRLDRLYDDKLDGRISTEFYEKKFRQYSTEKDTINSDLAKHTLANNRNFDESIKLYDLAQRSAELFRCAETTHKRDLMKLVFEDIQLRDGKISYTITLPFQLLGKAVEATNSSKAMQFELKSGEIFEPAKKEVNEPNFDKKPTLSPDVLRGRDSNPNKQIQILLSYH